MTREEFHRLYEQAPEDFKAELIGGVVHMPSPLRIRHAKNHSPLSAMFLHYESNTPGVECGDNATILLGEEGEPQPDLYLRILPECGGQSRTTQDDYVEGPPELVAEIAHSSRAIDLYEKKDDYGRYGALEYLVICLQELEIRWFDLTPIRRCRPAVTATFASSHFLDCGLKVLPSYQETVNSSLPRSNKVWPL